VSVEAFHLFRYLDEQAFCFYLRKEDKQGRFLAGMRGIIGKSLRYAKLIGREVENTYRLATFARGGKRQGRGKRSC
jgi:hypothetical protein